MREIKFRFLNEIKNMVYITVWGVNPPLKEEHLYPGTELMQYTGLKDKQGKEIYSGDVLRQRATEDGMNLSDYKKGAIMVEAPVVYDESICAFVMKMGLRFRIMEGLDLEIIGNVHQHPELLK